MGVLVAMRSHKSSKKVWASDELLAHKARKQKAGNLGVQAKSAAPPGAQANKRDAPSPKVLDQIGSALSQNGYGFAQHLKKKRFSKPFVFQFLCACMGEMRHSTVN